jgi:radical SAM protein with 4Fe4S-binding SPASM domain
MTLGLTQKRPRLLRVESFGAIVHLERPRSLVFVDRAYARRLGVKDSPRWTGPDDAPSAALGAAPLSAPLEAHLQLTNRCENGCRACYTGATPQGEAGEWGAEEWKRAIDRLAEMGVFHLALGGGESAALPWLGEVAAHARSRGLVPNLTTSGLTDLERLVSIAPLFGQINVSVDGIGADYEKVRGYDGYQQAVAALEALRRAVPHVGINCVVTRHNFEALPEMFRLARKLRLNELELLRFKPAGRGVRAFEAMTCTDDQHRRILPLALKLARRHRVRVRLDCSYTPMVVYHRPNARLLQWLAIYGCVGGDLLIGAKATGAATACSFAPPPPEPPRVHELDQYWPRDDAFAPFRSWREAEEPCRSCEALSLCRGGCRVVSAQVVGSLRAPDPECPKVVDYRRARSAGEGGGAGAPEAPAASPVVRSLRVL